MTSKLAVIRTPDPLAQFSAPKRKQPTGPIFPFMRLFSPRKMVPFRFQKASFNHLNWSEDRLVEAQLQLPSVKL
jgi:hypothetical protein